MGRELGSKFFPLFKNGYFSNAKYYALIAPINHWGEVRWEQKLCATAIPNITPEGKGVVVYACVLYVYSSLENAQKRANILGGAEPFEIECLPCFLSLCSSKREDDDSLMVVPFIDVILDESWHMELFACRTSEYTKITHAYLWDCNAPH